MHQNRFQLSLRLAAPDPARGAMTLPQTFWSTGQGIPLPRPVQFLKHDHLVNLVSMQYSSAGMERMLESITKAVTHDSGVARVFGTQHQKH